ncbi:MAG: DUF4190 domain-containing protein [Saprospiraceae bacterium]|uniref:DUF4190 domain-containing protein n=1 Tax=Candidatus Opimibacter skivensis TaxID=2982028 RepID=A0A9D7SSX2_9BACT|nr:DUF4190 domain-containing protein [Candidatus Opimibacter skivensis]
MKLKLILPFLFMTLFHPDSGYARHSSSPVNTEDHTGILHQTNPLDRTQIESQLGRKLKFKERIALSILKSKIRHAEKKGHALPLEYSQSSTEGFAIAGFVIGIVSVLLISLLFGILAIVFSAISLSKIRKYDGLYKGRGLATAGLVMGIVAVSLWVLVLALALAFFWV